MFICEIWLFNRYFPQYCKSDIRSTDISNCFRGSLRLRDNESRLYLSNYDGSIVKALARFFYLASIEHSSVKDNLCFMYFRYACLCLHVCLSVCLSTLVINKM